MPDFCQNLKKFIHFVKSLIGLIGTSNQIDQFEYTCIKCLLNCVSISLHSYEDLLMVGMLPIISDK